VNGVGTVDSDYRGEIKILLSTCSIDPVVLAAGERIAQGVVSKIERPLIEEARELSDTIRGSGGFGSTGITSTI
jgi:dUTP pyrophosphatase